MESNASETFRFRAYRCPTVASWSTRHFCAFGRHILQHAFKEDVILRTIYRSPTTRKLCVGNPSSDVTEQPQENSSRKLEKSPATVRLRASRWASKTRYPPGTGTTIHCCELDRK